MTDADLDAAVAAGVIGGSDADRLRRFLAERAHSGATHSGPAIEPDEENLRFITSFNDIFVTMGLGLFLGALAYFGVSVGGSSFAGPAIVAGASWVLAEFFTRQRRMALPSITLLVIFATSVFLAFAALFGVFDPRGSSLDSSDAVAILWGAAASLLTLGAIWLHWRRFRVPITVAAGAAALSGAVLLTVAAIVPDQLERNLNLVILLCGLAIFALAMRFDMSDVARVTRRSDVAFWLHLLAAPMIVHPLIRPFAGVSDMGAANAAMVLAVFLALAVVAVLVDRRAILVSGLSYAGYAFGVLLSQSGISGATVPVTLLVLGAFVLLLSAGWRPLRQRALRLLPPSLRSRVPGGAADFR